MSLYLQVNDTRVTHRLKDPNFVQNRCRAEDIELSSVQPDWFISSYKMHLVSVFMHNNEGAYLTPPLNVVVVVFLQTILMATLAIGGKQWPLQLEIPKYKNTCEGQGS